MKIDPPMSSALPKTHDKAALFAQFVLAHLRVDHADGSVAGREFSLIARSSESPIAQALVRVASEVASAGVRVRVIFATITGDAWTEIGCNIPFSRDVRWARNPRLIDAHEQLVLGPATCWIGDCMRRDPTKRDAFEQSKANCRSTAMLAATSFDRLWRVSDPYELRVPRMFQGVVLPDVLPPVISITPDDQVSRDD